jgi:hypothetical protein
MIRPATLTVVDVPIGKIKPYPRNPRIVARWEHATGQRAVRP